MALSDKKRVMEFIFFRQLLLNHLRHKLSTNCAKKLTVLLMDYSSPVKSVLIKKPVWIAAIRPRSSPVFDALSFAKYSSIICRVKFGNLAILPSDNRRLAIY